MLIYLVRHGEDKNDNLTKLGKKQIKLLAKTFKNTKFDAFYSSPLNRCLQTSNIINKTTKCNIVVDDRIKERFKLDHKPKTDHEKDWYNNYLNLDFESKTLECCKDFFARVFSFLDDVCKNKKQSNVLVVAHSALSYAFINYFCKTDCNIATWSSMANGSCIRFEFNQDWLSKADYVQKVEKNGDLYRLRILVLG